MIPRKSKEFNLIKCYKFAIQKMELRRNMENLQYYFSYACNNINTNKFTTHPRLTELQAIYGIPAVQWDEGSTVNT